MLAAAKKVSPLGSSLPLQQQFILLRDGKCGTCEQSSPHPGPPPRTRGGLGARTGAESRGRRPARGHACGCGVFRGRSALLLRRHVLGCWRRGAGQRGAAGDAVNSRGRAARTPRNRLCRRHCSGRAGGQQPLCPGGVRREPSPAHTAPGFGRRRGAIAAVRRVRLQRARRERPGPCPPPAALGAPRRRPGSGRERGRPALAARRLFLAGQEPSRAGGGPVTAPPGHRGSGRGVRARRPVLMVFFLFCCWKFCSQLRALTRHAAAAARSVRARSCHNRDDGKFTTDTSRV